MAAVNPPNRRIWQRTNQKTSPTPCAWKIMGGRGCALNRIQSIGTILPIAVAPRTYHLISSLRNLWLWWTSHLISISSNSWQLNTPSQSCKHFWRLMGIYLWERLYFGETVWMHNTTALDLEEVKEIVSGITGIFPWVCWHRNPTAPCHYATMLRMYSKMMLAPW